MARLPDPEVSEMEVVWSEDHKGLQESLYKWIGQAVRRRTRAEKKEGDVRDE